MTIEPTGICEVIGVQTWFRFGAIYFDGPREYGIEFWALDFADAQRRVELMRSFLRLDGQTIAEYADNRVLN